jgi:hypothetical protein
VCEVTPQDLVGRPGVINQVCITFGIFLESCLALLQGSQGFAFYFCLIPNLFPLIAILGMKTWLKFESPVYLWVSHRKACAANVIRRLAGERVDISSGQPSEYPQSVIESTSSQGSTLLLKNPLVQRILVLTMALSVMQQFTGINYALVFSVNSATYAEEDLARVILSGCAVLFSLATVFFIDCTLYTDFSRLTLLKVGAVGMFACNVVILSIWDSYDKSYLTFVFLFFFETSIGPVMWLYISELASPISMGIATACNWLGVLLISLISLVNNDDFDRAMYGVYCLDCILVRTPQIVVFARYFLIETSSRDSRDIESRMLSPLK